MNTQLEELKAKRDAAMKVVNGINNKIDALIEKEEIPALEKKYLGKYFKYRNSYGGNSKKWWLYKRVDAITGINSAITFSFQHCSYNSITIEPKKPDYLSNMGTQISAAEFNAAFKKVQQSIKTAKGK